MKSGKETFVEKLYECEQHKKRLLGAKDKLMNVMPLSIEVYERIDDIYISIIDQMILRFSKLQDTMGDKIFPGILELSGENVRIMTFIDRLNRLEELGLLYKDDWMVLRKERNEIAHEYSFNQDEVVESINSIYDRIDQLLSVYDTVYGYCNVKFDINITHRQ